MSGLMHLIKTQSLYLAPFFNSVIIYFASVRENNAEMWTTVLKCTPIVCLIMYILTKGFAFSKNFKISQRVLLGLIFSCAGDALLNIDLFQHGMGAFALAQICYISAFGWHSLKLRIGVLLYLLGAVFVALVLRNLDELLIVGVPIYATLLLTMCWRSIAQATVNPDFLHIFCAFGSILFVISDGLICVNMFLMDIQYSRIWIMITYYLAQFAITLITCKEQSLKKLSPKFSKESIAKRRHFEKQPCQTGKLKD